jgi:site-specific DNA recombinase
VMRVAAYVRVSTEEQATEGFSLEAQQERLQAYCKAQGWKSLKFYIEEGKTGRRTEVRPVYRRMMQEIESWDVLLVVKMDRVHRNSKNFITMMEALEKCKRKFASVTEAFDTSTAMGRFVMDIIQRIAQLESETIGERTFWGMEQKAKSKGGSLGKAAPLGYTWQRGKLELDGHAPLAILEKMFRKAANPYVEMTYAELARWTEGRLTRFQVRRILTNPTYAGCTMWNGIVQVGTHKALVPIGTFREVQERFKTGVVI